MAILFRMRNVIASERPSFSPAREQGYFPRGKSVLRQVHEQRVVGLLYGQRALGVGAVAPLNFVGTRLHTRALGTPFKRLAHTGKWFETVFFGSRAEADRVLAAVHAMHERVKGTLPYDAGPFKAGTPYSAFDPELMLWTVAVMADSAQVFYELFVRELSPGERERLWQDYVRFAELFGMPREAAPASYPEFRSWYDGRIEGHDAFLTEEARFTGHAVMFQIPVPASRRPAMRMHNLIVLGSLPPRVRELYGLRWTPARAAAFRAAVTALRPALARAPRAVRSGWNTRFFDDVASAEERLMARGHPVPGALTGCAGTADDAP